MANDKHQRRVQRTRMHLHQALLELVVERGYREITVQDILDRANVGRTTFYAHFRDKDELLMSGMEPLHEQLMTTVRSLRTSPDSPPLSFVKEFFRLAQVYLESYRALSGPMRIDAQNRLTAMLVELAHEEFKLRSTFRRSRLTVEPIAYGIAGTVMGLVEWWIRQEHEVSIDDLHAVFQRLVGTGFQDAIRQPPAIGAAHVPSARGNSRPFLGTDVADDFE